MWIYPPQYSISLSSLTTAITPLKPVIYFVLIVVDIMFTISKNSLYSTKYLFIQTNWLSAVFITFRMAVVQFSARLLW